MSKSLFDKNVSYALVSSVEEYEDVLLFTRESSVFMEPNSSPLPSVLYWIDKIGIIARIWELEGLGFFHSL